MHAFVYEAILNVLSAGEMQSECGALCARLNIHSVVKMDRLTPLEILWQYCKQIQYTNLWAGL